MGEIVFGKGIGRGGFTLGEQATQGSTSDGWGGWNAMTDGSALDNTRDLDRTKAYVELVHQHGPDDFTGSVVVYDKAGFRELSRHPVRGTLRGILREVSVEQGESEAQITAASEAGRRAFRERQKGYQLPKGSGGGHAGDGFDPTGMGGE